MELKKKCTICNKNKELKEFSKDKNGKFGVKSRCRVCIKEYMGIYNVESKDVVQKYYLDNREKLNIQAKINYDKDPKIHKKRVKNWRQNNKEKYNQNLRNRRKNEPDFKIKERLRYHLWKNTKGKKLSGTFELLGCILEIFRKHIESQFKPEMTWDNHGKVWELDHIIPCSKFDLTKLEEQQKCFHYTNLQPLFKTTEIAKSLGYDDIIGNRNKSNKV